MTRIEYLFFLQYNFNDFRPYERYEPYKLYLALSTIVDNDISFLSRKALLIDLSEGHDIPTVRSS